VTPLNVLELPISLTDSRRQKGILTVCAQGMGCDSCRYISFSLVTRWRATDARNPCRSAKPCRLRTRLPMRDCVGNIVPGANRLRAPILANQHSDALLRRRGACSIVTVANADRKSAARPGRPQSEHLHAVFADCILLGDHADVAKSFKVPPLASMSCAYPVTSEWLESNKSPLTDSQNRPL
jgi:hypothetical protein